MNLKIILLPIILFTVTLSAMETETRILQVNNFAALLENSSVLCDKKEKLLSYLKKLKKEEPEKYRHFCQLLEQENQEALEGGITIEQQDPKTELKRLIHDDKLRRLIQNTNRGARFCYLGSGLTVAVLVIGVITLTGKLCL